MSMSPKDYPAIAYVGLQEEVEKRVGLQLGAIGRSQLIELILLLDIKELMQLILLLDIKELMQVLVKNTISGDKSE